MSQRLYFPREQVFNNLGLIGAGFKLFTYETGTTTPLATYSDTALTIANANPTIADSAGRFGDIYVNDLKLYRAILTDANDNVLWTADPVDPKTFTLADFDPQPTAFLGTTEGTASAYTLTTDVGFTQYLSTQTFLAQCQLDNNASSTININGLGALTEKKYDGAGSKVDLEASDKQAGQTYFYRIDGSDAIILNPEKPYFDGRNIFQATTLVKGVTLLPSKPTISNGTDTEHDIDISAFTMQFSDGSGRAACSAITKQADATWADGTGAGGMASGQSLPTSGTIHLFALSNALGTLTDAGFDTSATATNLLADSAVTTYFGGTPKYERIFSIITNSSANISQFNKYDKTIIYKTPTQAWSATNPGTSAVLRTLPVPTGIQVISIHAIQNLQSSNNATLFSIITGPDQNDTAPSGTSFSSVVTAEGENCVTNIMVVTNTSGQIRQRLDSSTAATSTTGIVYGFIDFNLR